MPVPVQEPAAWERRVVSRLVETFLYRRLKGPTFHPPAHLDGRPFTLTAVDGARLSCHHYPAPHGHPKGLVVLAHPHKRYGQHWFVREGWIDWLHAHGYDALTFDFTRYGASRGGTSYLHDQVLAVARHGRRLAMGRPVHVVGVSIGSFAVANAAPHLDFVESLTLESPYPTFADWYSHADADPRTQRINRLFGRLFPTTYLRINAPRNLAHAAAPRILVVAMTRDQVTAPALSRRVAEAGPRDRTRYLELDGPAHLEAFRSLPEYRDALLGHLEGEPAVAVSVAAGTKAKNTAQPSSHGRGTNGSAAPRMEPSPVPSTA